MRFSPLLAEDLSSSEVNAVELSDNSFAYVDSDNEVLYIFEYSDSEVIATDVTTGEIFVNKIVYSRTSRPFRRYLYEAMDSSYENWNTQWLEYRRGRVKIASGATAVIAQGALEAALRGTGIHIPGIASFLFSLATSITDMHLNNCYFITYYRTNIDCGFLAKTYTAYYTNSDYTGLIESSPETHMWTDTTWNYSYPAPCRTLVNTYPYVA